MNLKEFRKLLETNEEEAIKLLNDVFDRGLDVNQLKTELGFSWGAIRPEIESLGYHKPKNKLICKIGEQGEKIVMNNNKNQFTDEEILILKELCKNRTESTEDITIKNYDDYKQRSILISERLLKQLDEIYSNNKVYRKQDIFNKIIELGIDTYNKNFNK
jgi:hypothetical protein